MKLSDYISHKKISQSDFGKLIGASQAAVGRYMNGDRLPRPDILSRIFEVTAGHVTANDFYDLPKKKVGRKLNQNSLGGMPTNSG